MWCVVARSSRAQRLFQYVDDDGTATAISSTDVNDYLRDATGLDVTAKTFRTWGASVLAAEELSALEAPASAREASISINSALRPVAARLGNTVSVCRNSYVHPVVLSEFEKGTLAERWAGGPARAAGRCEPPSADCSRCCRIADATHVTTSVLRNIVCNR